MAHSTALEAARHLKEAGLMATRQRVELFSQLMRAKHPRSAESLKGSMDLTTVYRGLDQLVSAGLVRRIDLGKNHALYELAGNHHHHVVCRTCGRIEDVTACVPSSLTKAVLTRATRFSSIEDHALEFFGSCKSCAKRK